MVCSGEREYAVVLAALFWTTPLIIARYRPKTRLRRSRPRVSRIATHALAGVVTFNLKTHLDILQHLCIGVPELCRALREEGKHLAALHCDRGKVVRRLHAAARQRYMPHACIICSKLEASVSNISMSSAGRDAPETRWRHHSKSIHQSLAGLSCGL